MRPSRRARDWQPGKVNQRTPGVGTDAAAAEAARAAGVIVREVDDVAELARIEELLGRVWATDGPTLISVNFLRALAHTDHYVSAAWAGDVMVGASVAFWWGPDRPGTLHSHITGVAPDIQSRGVGLAMKLHQAAWTRAKGGKTVTWTFDPLVRRNAWFNLMKLGAELVAYHPNFYGEMNDGLNQGQPTDRGLVVWDVSGVPVVDNAFEASNVLLRVGPDDHPIVEAVAALEGVLLCQVPADLVGLRRAEPGIGLVWAEALRQTMGRALDEGYVAKVMTDDGFYVLRRPARPR